MSLNPAIGIVVLCVLLTAAGAQEADNPRPGQPAPAESGAAEAPRPPAEAPVPDRKELEEKFAKALSGATLVGFFTDTSNDRPPAEEKYTLSKVTKLQGDYWLFAARIQFGERDVTVPLMLPVKWAGDTPVITLTNMGIPGLGTYTARVMIYDDHYAGTWKGGDHGGHLWGRIERADNDEKTDQNEKKGAAGTQ